MLTKYLNSLVPNHRRTLLKLGAGLFLAIIFAAFIETGYGELHQNPPDNLATQIYFAVVFNGILLAAMTFVTAASNFGDKEPWDHVGSRWHEITRPFYASVAMLVLYMVCLAAVQYGTSLMGALALVASCAIAGTTGFHVQRTLRCGEFERYNWADY